MRNYFLFVIIFCTRIFEDFTWLRVREQEQKLEKLIYVNLKPIRPRCRAHFNTCPIWNPHERPWTWASNRCRRNLVHSWIESTANSTWPCTALSFPIHRIFAVFGRCSVRWPPRNYCRTIASIPYRKLQWIHLIDKFRELKELGMVTLPVNITATLRFCGTFMTHVQSLSFRSVFG